VGHASAFAALAVGAVLVVVMAACGQSAPRADGPAPSATTPATTTGDDADAGATIAPLPTDATDDPNDTADTSDTTDDGSGTTVTSDPNGVSGEAGPPDDPTVPSTAVYPPCTQTQGRIDHRTFNSSVMRYVHPVEGYNVYTPPCYDRDANRRYPVIYLLHGANHDENEWVSNGLTTTATQLVDDGEIPPVIIVMPDGMDAMGDYDAAPGQLQPFDFFLLYEIKPRVEQAYRTLNHRFYRAIGGISRGGEWALLEAERHPDVFSAVGGHSPAIGSPTNPAATLAPLLAGKGLRIWLDVGTDDSLLPNVTALDTTLTAQRTAHDFQTGPGGHTDAYWGANAAAYLRWYTQPWH
jgi:enterochelin esterase-like enzyme